MAASSGHFSSGSSHGREISAGEAARALTGVAPWLALAARPAPPARRLALAGGLLQLTVRFGGRLVAGADPRLAVAYPAADLVLLAIYTDSVRRPRTGAARTWKGRAYRSGP